MSSCPECGAEISAARDACECGRDLSSVSAETGELNRNGRSDSSDESDRNDGPDTGGESDVSDAPDSYEERVERMKAYPLSERARICMGFRDPDDVATTSLSNLRRLAILVFGLVCFWFTATHLFPPTSNLKLLAVALLAPVLGVGSLLISYTGRRIDYEKYMPQ